MSEREAYTAEPAELADGTDVLPARRTDYPGVVTPVTKGRHSLRPIELSQRPISADYHHGNRRDGSGEGGDIKEAVRRRRQSDAKDNGRQAVAGVLRPEAQGATPERAKDNMSKGAQWGSYKHDSGTEPHNIYEVFQRCEAQTGGGAIDQTVARLVKVQSLVCKQSHRHEFRQLLDGTDHEQHAHDDRSKIGVPRKYGFVEEHRLDDSGGYRGCHAKQEREGNEASGFGTVDVPANEKPDPEEAWREGQHEEYQKFQGETTLPLYDYGVAYEVVQPALVFSDAYQDVADEQDQGRQGMREVPRERSSDADLGAVRSEYIETEDALPGGRRPDGNPDSDIQDTQEDSRPIGLAEQVFRGTAIEPE